MMTDTCPACVSLWQSYQNALSANDVKKAATMLKLYNQHVAQHNSPRKRDDLIHQLWPNATVR